MSENMEVAIYDGVPPALRPEAMQAQVALIQGVMKSVMRNGEHYGTIPGCGNKPTLLQPGAQKLIMTFRLVPDPEIDIIDMQNQHREYRAKVRLSTQNGIFLGAGVGSCSTMEGRYRYRNADLVCPVCGKDAIIKGKVEFGGGWVCYPKKGGCGKKWTDADNPFVGVISGKVEHDNPADYYNTCEKMAFKRALVSATLTVTAASDIFTQDIEDMVGLPLQKITSEKSTEKPIEAPKAKATQNPDTPNACNTIDTISDAQVKRFLAIARGSGYEDEEIKKWLLDSYDIDSSKKIPKAQYEEICKIVGVKKDV